MEDRFSEHCRKEAEDCRREAERVLSPLDKNAWLNLADEWMKLVESRLSRKSLVADPKNHRRLRHERAWIWRQRVDTLPRNGEGRQVGRVSREAPEQGQQAGQ